MIMTPLCGHAVVFVVSKNAEDYFGCARLVKY